MTREEAWALFAAHALGETIQGTPHALEGDKLSWVATQRVELAAKFADAMSEQWESRHREPVQPANPGSVDAVPSKSKKRPPESKL